MGKISYSFEKGENKIVFRCNDEQIVEKATEYIDMLLKSKAYESIENIPIKATYV